MGHMGEQFQSIYDHGEPLLSTLSESCRGQKSIPNVVHFVRDTSVSKYHPKPSPTVQKRSKQGFLMPKTTRIPFLMVPNLYFSLFWLKNEDLFDYRVISLNCRIISGYCGKTEMLRMMNKVANERHIIDIYSDTLVQSYFLGRGPSGVEDLCTLG